MTSTTGQYDGIRTSTRNRRKVLLLTAGQGEDWKLLQRHLERSNWAVVAQAMEDVVEAGGPRYATPRLDGTEIAILVVGHHHGGTESNLRATRELLFHAGWLEGHLGYRRVLAMVEDRVGVFLENTGIQELSFTSGDIQDRFRQIDATLDDLGANPPHGREQSGFERWMRRFGLEPTEIPSEVWLWVGVAALFVTIMSIIFADLIRSDDGSDDAGVTVVTEQPTAGDVGVVPTTIGAGTAVDGRAGPDPAANQGPIPPINDGLLPGAVGGRVEALPSSCTVSTGGGELTPDQLVCGGGGLVATGYLGPWRDEISAVTLGQGVVGEARMTSLAGDAAGGTVELLPGRRVELEPFGSLDGVDELVLEFSANNESVVLHRPPGRGGDELVLTFSLDG